MTSERKGSQEGQNTFPTALNINKAEGCAAADLVLSLSLFSPLFLSFKFSLSINSRRVMGELKQSRLVERTGCVKKKAEPCH